jgi:hypothetical protein
MNRRDFLLLRKDTRQREFELSCDRLYMQCLDTGLSGLQPEDEADPAETSPWGGEPPARFAGRSREQLFEALDLELRKVEVLKVVNSQWLVGELRHDFDRLMVGFCARGGRVEIQA